MVDTLPRLQAALSDRYRIEDELGRGGMATVYLADDMKHRRQVAVKVLRAELASVLGADRFLREVEIAAKLNHPHILPLYDSGESGGFLFYVMPFVKGQSLRARLLREGQLSVEEAVTIARQVAAALGHAHERNVIHRDVKPENILLHEGEAMVADFGIALATSPSSTERLTERGLAMGTPAYMSPEQAMSDGTPDARSDVYSLGCVLYEMLAGEPPYTGTNAQGVLAKQLVDPVPAVRRLRATVPLAVEQAITRALAREPADRFATTGDFAAALTAPPRTKTAVVAVLPFLNLSADPENEYFADGITEDVIAQLSKIGALKVISRSSVMAFKHRVQSLREIGAKLGASTLLEGSVRRAGDRVRIVAQLIDAETDQHLWAETYDRQLTDIFVIQTDVALQIATALKAELSVDEQARIRKEPTSDLRAYQLYLQGRHSLVRYTTAGLQQAITYFERAIGRDPEYALPHASVAMAYVEMGEGGAMTPDLAHRQADEAASAALALDPALAEAHCAKAYLAMWYFDWVTAEAGFKRALELSPSNAVTYDLYGRLCSALGRHEEAIAMQRRARELDPLAHPLDVATALIRAGRYDEATHEAARAVEDDPDLDRAHATLAWAHMRRGLVSEGLAGLEKAVSMSPGNTQWLAQLGLAYAITGQTAKARDLLRQLEDRSQHIYVSPYHLSFVYTGLGEHERALDLIERAVAERAGAVYGLKGSFLLEPLRAHPRFIALLARMNLT